jgi:hypothetical protein
VRFHAVWIVALLLGGLCAAQADDLLQDVQRELRARKLYFGAIDGRASDDIASALRKFQRLKGLDATGNLDDGTIRALGLQPAERALRGDAAVLDTCANLVLHYLQARQSGDWNREAAFYEEQVDYLEDGLVDREFIRDTPERDSRRWPVRKTILLNRIASLVPNHPGEVLVTARIRSEMSGGSGPKRIRTEDLTFLLRSKGSEWRIAAIKMLP